MRKKRILSMLLALTLCLTLIPSASFATASDVGTGNVPMYLDFLGRTTEAAHGLPASSPQEVPDDLAVNDILWFGLRVKDMTSANWATLGERGIYGITMGFNYDADYITPYLGEGYATVNPWDDNKTKYQSILRAINIGTSDKPWITAYNLEPNASVPEQDSVDTTWAEESTLDGANIKQMGIQFQMGSTGTPANYQRFYKKTAAGDQYLALFPMQLKSLPTTPGKKIIETSLGGKTFVISVLTSGAQDPTLSGSWDATGNSLGGGATNMSTVFQYMGDPVIFPQPKTLTEITIKTAPTLDYVAGKNFDPSKLVATYKYNDGSTSEKNAAALESKLFYGATNDATAATTALTKTTKITDAMNNAYVFVKEELTDGTIVSKLVGQLTVTADSVKSISVTGSSNTKYKEGETLNIDGLTVVVTMESGAKENIAASDFATRGVKVTINGDEVTSNVTKAKLDYNGKKYVFTYQGKEAETGVSISVTGASVNGIAKKSAPDKLTYVDGSKFDPTGTVVTLSYDNGTQKDVALADFAKENITFTIGGKAVTTATDITSAMNGQKLEAVYGTLKAELGTITVSDAKVTNIVIKTQPKTTYTYGDKLDLSALVATVTFDKTSMNGDYTYEQLKGLGFTFKIGTNDADAVELVAATTGSKITVARDGQQADTDALTVNKVKPTLTFSGLKQQKGSTTEVKVNVVPATDVAVVIEYEEVTTSGAAATWKVLDKNSLKSLEVGKYNVRATIAEGTNTLAATETAELEITAEPVKPSRPSGGSSSRDYTVRFNAGANGVLDGSKSVSVERGEKLKSSDVPTVKANEGFRFIGWSLDGKTVIDPTKEEVTGSLTYTALYEKYNAHKPYMSGYSDGTFRPDGRTTRAEVASLMAGLIEGYDSAVANNGIFSDVENAWYAKAVTFMSQKGLISGYNDGSFRPNNQITRQEFCAIIAKYLGLSAEGTANFNDVAEAWGQGYIAQLASKGIISGYSDGSFRPDQAITRAEVTTILNKVFNKTPDADLVDENIDNYTVRMSDVSKNHWAYYQILEAAVEHEMTDFHK